MKSRNLLLLIASIKATVALYAGDDCNFEYKETIVENKELRFDPKFNHQEIVVNNIHGSIEVEGYKGETVLLEVERSIKARSEPRLAIAKEEVWLDMQEQGDAIIIYVEGPFRDRGGNINHRGCRYYGYKNRFDIRLRVPQKSQVYLKNINGGPIRAENLNGKFDVKNINGPIEMSSISGSGRVHALNGSVTVSFSGKPEGDCFLNSHNGNVRAVFPSDLNADLYFKTRNGKVYSDFEVNSIPWGERKSEIELNVEDEDGLRVYKSDRSQGVRVGKGGSKYRFETFNGNIFIKKSDTK